MLYTLFLEQGTTTGTIEVYLKVFGTLLDVDGHLLAGGQKSFVNAEMWIQSFCNCFATRGNLHPRCLCAPTVGNKYHLDIKIRPNRVMSVLNKRNGYVI